MIARTTKRCETCHTTITADDHRDHDGETMRENLERWCRTCVLGIDTAVTEQEVEAWAH